MKLGVPPSQQAQPLDCGSLLPLSQASPAGGDGREMNFNTQRLDFDLHHKDSGGSKAASEKRQQAAALHGASHFDSSF